MFPKKKYYGRVKGCGCANDQKQWGYINKEEYSSPIVTMEELILSCIMDTLDGRDVTMVNMPGDFIHADMYDIVNMLIHGAMAELLMRVDPGQYEKQVVVEKGKKVLYVSFNKALYGTLNTAFLF